MLWLRNRNGVSMYLAQSICHLLCPVSLTKQPASSACSVGRDEVELMRNAGTGKPGLAFYGQLRALVRCDSD